MKFKQLCESEHTIEDIYNILVKDCQQFKQLSKDFKNVPMRMLGGGFNHDEFFDEDTILTIDSLPGRSSLTAHNSLLQHTYKLFNDLIIKQGHASRIHHMYSTSSLGDNKAYGVEVEESAFIFPIGDFKYSYIPEDFNVYFDIRAFNVLYSQEVESEVRGSLVDMVNQYVESMKEDYDEGSKSYHNAMFQVERMKEQLDNVSSIRSENYSNAFIQENEIWFNSKSYHAISYQTYERLLAYMAI